MYLLISAVTFLVLFAALIDIITRPEGQVKHLPKLFWVVLVILLPFIGSILWFTVGREWDGGEGSRIAGPRRRDVGRPAAERQPTRAAPQRALSTEEQLAALEREAEFYEKQARIRRLEAELDGKRQSEA
jgi:hypothetical protein